MRKKFDWRKKMIKETPKGKKNTTVDNITR